MYGLILLATVGLLPYSPAIEDRAEKLELNHFYQRAGTEEPVLTFTQVIVWRRMTDGHWHVADWRIVRDEKQWPRRDARGGYMWIFMDNERLRRVRARMFRETWSLHDREMADRQRWEPEWRIGLTKRGAMKR